MADQIFNQRAYKEPESCSIFLCILRLLSGLCGELPCALHASKAS